MLEYWNVEIMCLNKGLGPKAKGARYNQFFLPYALSLVPYAIHYSMHKAKDLFNFSQL
jgi:hypothetical protein